MLVLRLINESLLFALRAIGVNKTRTMLSLLGITIGIFSVITVFTIFDSMENSIKKSIDSLGNNILFITKWPWSMDIGDDYPGGSIISDLNPVLLTCMRSIAEAVWPKQFRSWLELIKQLNTRIVLYRIPQSWAFHTIITGLCLLIWVQDDILRP